MKKLLLYNHGGCGNRGCEAIVRSTSELFIREAGASCALCTDEPEADRAIGIESIAQIDGAVISPRSLARVVNSIAFRLGQPRKLEIARKYGPVVRAGKRSDICLSVGGDTYCYNWQEHLSVINERLRAAGKPLVLWGCSVEPSLLEDERTLADFRAYDLIVARESISAQALQEKGLPVRQWSDPAFLLRREELTLPEGWREGKTVGLNVSPLVLNKTPDRARAVDAFAALIRHILEDSDRRVALVPHVVWAHDNDLDALGEIKARFGNEKRVILLPGSLGAMQLKGYISRMEALVTARTHASIAAYSTGVPTLVIGYSVKARGIARDLFGSEEGHLIEAQKLTDARELIDAFDAMMARAGEERRFLAGRLPAYTAGAGEIVREVLALGGKK